MTTTPYPLETRTCACGCGHTFRALPTSPQRYWAKWHEEEHRPKSKDPQRMNDHLFDRVFAREEREDDT